MSAIKTKFQGRELKFTFNSFKFMEDLDFSVLEEKEIQTKPFKIVPVLETLMYGAVNSNPKIVVSIDDVQVFLEEFISNDGDIVELFTDLMETLQDSSFFKSLQKK